MKKRTELKSAKKSMESPPRKFTALVMKILLLCAIISFLSVSTIHSSLSSTSMYDITRESYEDLTNGMLESAEFYMTAKGAKNVCPLGKSIQTAEQCVDAAYNLGLPVNQVVPVVRGNWKNLPRGCFTSGGAMYFSKSSEKSINVDEVFLNRFSLICRRQAVEGAFDIHSISDEESMQFEYFSLKEKQEKPEVTIAEEMSVKDMRKLVRHKKYNYPADPTRAEDKDCIFLNSSLYRSIYVYPTWMNKEDGWHGPILHDKNKNVAKWPWIEMDERAKKERFGQYAEKPNEMGHYSLELIVREIITHPDSCLRTMDPMKASLFYVPYLPSTEFHNVTQFPGKLDASAYATAIEAAVDGKYGQWEHYFGLTSEFWKRKRGADHILVFPEPLHGISHPKGKRGSFHYIYTQKMLSPPIILSTEVSASFVNMYPKCSSKNILAPYPELDADWYNGQFDIEANMRRDQFEVLQKAAYLQFEKGAFAVKSSGELSNTTAAKPVAQFFSKAYIRGGAYGPCRNVLLGMHADYKCTRSAKALKRTLRSTQFGMRLSTFCPCPGGYSASAKRIFDAVNSGCIPVMLSEDTIWPFTNEADASFPLDPTTFSLRWNTKDFVDAKYDKNCRVISTNNTRQTFQERIEKIESGEIMRLREGMKKALKLYSYWSKESFMRSKNPLHDGILPDGGASIALVKLLGERAGGAMWPDCQIELEDRMVEKDPNEFQC